MKKKILIILVVSLILLAKVFLIIQIVNVVNDTPPISVGSGGAENGSSSNDADDGTDGGSSDQTNGGDVSSGEVLPEATSFVFECDGVQYVADCSKNFLEYVSGTRMVTNYNQLTETASTEQDKIVTIGEDGLAYFECAAFTDRFCYGSVSYFGGAQYAFFYKVFGSNTYYLIDGKNSDFSVSCDGKYKTGASFENYSLNGVFLGMDLVHIQDNVDVYISDSNFKSGELPRTVSFYLFKVSA